MFSDRDSYVRNIQALVNHGITQSLVFVVMIVSFQRNEIQEACLALGSLLHYIILVSYMWLVFQPIVLVISQIRRQLYEKGGFILPFFFMAWCKLDSTSLRIGSTISILSSYSSSNCTYCSLWSIDLHQQTRNSGQVRLVSRVPTQYSLSPSVVGWRALPFQVTSPISH